MISYTNEIIDKNITYSVDMVRFDFTLRADKQKEIEAFASMLGYLHWFERYLSFRLYNFRELFVSPCGVKIGLGFNGAKEQEKLKGFIEFNPNKQYELFTKIKPKLNEIAKNYSLKSWDLAIDIPKERNAFFILKTQKHYRFYEKYIESVKTHSITEYLGKRNSNGFFKLYNKSVESGLNYDLTRAELTLDNLDYINFTKQMPDVLYLRDEVDFNFIPAIKGLLRLSIEYNDFTNINFLDYSTRQKIKNQLKYNSLNVSKSIFQKLTDFVKQIIDYN